MSHFADKIAFVHSAKAAGRYTNHYLGSQVFRNKGSNPAEHPVKTFNSWENPFFLKRDWTEQELLQLAGNKHPTQYPTPDQVREHHALWQHDYLERQYVHNHHFSWTSKAVDEFHRHGWLLFTFLRDPAERLCSLWTWAQREVAKGTDPVLVISPSWLLDLSLDAFLCEILSNPELQEFYALPDYLGELDFVAEFSAKNFARFLRVYFDHDYRPEKVDEIQKRSSGNPGYAQYRSRGLISDRSDELVSGNEEVRRARELLQTGATGSIKVRTSF